MKGPHLIYFADPMCSWCWGIRAGHHGHHATLRRHVAGPADPGRATPRDDQADDEAAKSSIREHWNHVQAASGQPFDLHFSSGTASSMTQSLRPAPWLSCAGMAWRRRSLTSTWSSGRFYAENKDVTDHEILADLVAGVDIDRATFLVTFAVMGKNRNVARLCNHATDRHHRLPEPDRGDWRGN
jgi:putative protein-disulfide isomerase